MLKIYKCADGRTYQFEEGKQPADAVLIEPKKEPSKKEAAAPANKARKPKTK